MTLYIQTLTRLWKTYELQLILNRKICYQVLNVNNNIENTEKWRFHWET